MIIDDLALKLFDIVCYNLFKLCMGRWERFRSLTHKAKFEEKAKISAKITRISERIHEYEEDTNKAYNGIRRTCFYIRLWFFTELMDFEAES